MTCHAATIRYNLLAVRDDVKRKAKQRSTKKAHSALRGRVVATRGRRVLVATPTGEDVVCFLAGRRAVIGDEVHWERVPGEGGRLVEVLPRVRELIRVDFKGRTRAVASHLGGLLVVASAQQPPYRPGLIDRYAIAASAAGIDWTLVLTKVDLGVPSEVMADLDWRREQGVTVITTCPVSGDGIQELLEHLESERVDGPWAMVGHSGVGKTSLAAALLPEEDVGPVGEISAHWGTGQHTTTGSRILPLSQGVEIADSPGIRTFLPDGLNAKTVRDHFPGMDGVVCRYRDCLHRAGEEGCGLEDHLPPSIVERYRRVLNELVGLEQRSRTRQG